MKKRVYDSVPEAILVNVCVVFRRYLRCCDELELYNPGFQDTTQGELSLALCCHPYPPVKNLNFHRNARREHIKAQLIPLDLNHTLWDKKQINLMLLFSKYDSVFFSPLSLTGALLNFALYTEL